MERKERNSSFELLRIICIFGIITMHTWGPALSGVNGVNMVIAVGVNTLFNTCVSIFVLISGYYDINIEKKPQKVINLWIQVIFCSLLSYIIVGVANSSWSMKGLINACLPVSRNQYWFATSYILLMFLSPFLNKATNAISRDYFRKLLIVLIFAFSIIPTVVFDNILGDSGKGPANVILMYLIGRYIRLYYENERKLKKYTLVAFLLILIQFIGNISATALWRNILGKESIFCPLAADYSIFIVAGSVAIFMCFKAINFHSKLINKIAKHTFSMYLLEGAIRSLLSLRFDIYEYMNLPLFSLYVCGIVILTMAIAGIIDLLRELICSPISKILVRLLHKLAVLQ